MVDTWTTTLGLEPSHNHTLLSCLVDPCALSSEPAPELLRAAIARLDGATWLNAVPRVKEQLRQISRIDSLELTTTGREFHLADAAVCMIATHILNGDAYYATVSARGCALVTSQGCEALGVIVSRAVTGRSSQRYSP
jgi:hypothetical protein